MQEARCYYQDGMKFQVSDKDHFMPRTVDIIVGNIIHGGAHHCMWLVCSLYLRFQMITSHTIMLTVYMQIYCCLLTVLPS